MLQGGVRRQDGAGHLAGSGMDAGVHTLSWHRREPSPAASWWESSLISCLEVTLPLMGSMNLGRGQLVEGRRGTKLLEQSGGDHRALNVNKWGREEGGSDPRDPGFRMERTS